MTNEELFLKYTEIYNAAELNKELSDIVDIDAFIKTPAAPSLDTGVAFEGGLMQHTIAVWHFAKKMIGVYQSIFHVNEKTLAKVVVLHQLGKVGMFEPNTNEWEINKLGKAFTFAETGVCLKTGERSKMVCSNAGIVFTPEEYEAMTILDKTAEEYDKMAPFRTHLSTILKMASDLAYTYERVKYKQNKA